MSQASFSVCGVILTYAQNQLDAQARVAQILSIITKMDEISEFDQVIILIWKDPLDSSSDFGWTKELLEEKIEDYEIRVRIIETSLDPFVGQLNLAAHLLQETTTKWMMTLSPELVDLFLEEVDDLLQNLDETAAVTGVACGEIKEAALEGRIANMFAIWDIGKLLSVGGFNMTSRMRQKYEVVPMVDVGGTTYKMQGVEEMVPLAFLVRYFKKCISVYTPKTKHAYSAISAEEQQRSKAKFASKLARQEHFLKLVGFTIEKLKEGVIDN